MDEAAQLGNRDRVLLPSTSASSTNGKRRVRMDAEEEVRVLLKNFKSTNHGSELGCVVGTATQEIGFGASGTGLVILDNEADPG